MTDRPEGLDRRDVSSAGEPGSPVSVPTPVLESETQVRLDRPWNVIVWDDPINLMSYVVYVFQRLFGFSLAKATEKMLEVHQQGRSVVATVDREEAEFYVARLHGYGLQASLQQMDA